MPDITYRSATVEDARRISSLIIDSQRKYCFHEYTDAGQTLMIRLCGEAAIRSYIERDDVYFVAVNDNEIIGVVGVRDNGHLAHNFVDDGFHRRGVSNDLWQLAKSECRRRGNPGTYTLRASTFAIPVYKRWGFVQTAATDQENGITSTPMTLGE